VALNGCLASRSSVESQLPVSRTDKKPILLFSFLALLYVSQARKYIPGEGVEGETSHGCTFSSSPMNLSWIFSVFVGVPCPGF
jgi:hypothetical protein